MLTSCRATHDMILMLLFCVYKSDRVKHVETCAYAQSESGNESLSLCVCVRGKARAQTTHTSGQL